MFAAVAGEGYSGLAITNTTADRIARMLTAARPGRVKSIKDRKTLYQHAREQHFIDETGKKMIKNGGTGWFGSSAARPFGRRNE